MGYTFLHVTELQSRRNYLVSIDLWESQSQENYVFRALGVNEENEASWRNIICMVDRNCPVSSEVTRRQQNKGKGGIRSVFISLAEKRQGVQGSEPRVASNVLNTSFALLPSPRPCLWLQLQARAYLWLYPNYLQPMEARLCHPEVTFPGSQKNGPRRKKWNYISMAFSAQFGKHFVLG